MKLIKCRLLIPDGNKWIDFNELSENEKHRISSEYAERMKTAIHDCPPDPAAFEKLRGVNEKSVYEL